MRSQHGSGARPDEIRSRHLVSYEADARARPSRGRLRCHPRTHYARCFNGLYGVHSKITWPIENVGWLGCFASAIASKKLNKILAEEPQIAELENPVELSKTSDLEFHHVDFSCMTHRFCRISTLPLKQGHTRHHGYDGFRKTTIVNLLERFTMSPTVPSVSTATTSAPCRCAPCAIFLPSSCRTSSCSQTRFLRMSASAAAAR